MTNYTEQPFQFLKRKQGKSDADTNKVFSPAIIENWYKARAFILQKLNNESFEPESDKLLHWVVLGDSPLMLSVARQIALSAHFVKYYDRHTLITIVSQKDNIKEDLEKEEFLCNLPKLCKSVIYGVEDHKDSYIDIDLQVVKRWEAHGNKGYIEIREEEVDTFCQSHEYDKIDTRKAVFASRIYDLGSLISNVPYEDFHDTHRYSQAIDAFQYIQLEKPWKSLINKDNQDDLTKVKEALSNIFCADCFETREKEIEAMKKADIDRSSDEKEKKKIRKENYWEKHIEALSKSEHARWVAEKLIMGYRPLNSEERIKDERIMGPKKLKEHRKRLKSNPKNPVHIDLCSYDDLRRIDPDNMRYDSFLMLSIPEILKRCSLK